MSKIGVFVGVGGSLLGLVLTGRISLTSAVQLGSVLILLGLGLLAKQRAFSDTSDLVKSFQKQEEKRGIRVDKWIDEYNDLQNDSKTEVDERNTKYQKLVNAYYELATIFYEWGWGQSFHFAFRMKGENFFESIRRHEYYLASKMNLKASDKLLDCGCGVGGPYRNISRFTGCDITGVTINDYQVQRGNALNKQERITETCRSVQGDFMDLKFDDESFDGVYAIEATCHAPDRTKVFSEILRVLKPGKIFACYEWCLTDSYDANNEQHKQWKKMIEEGDGLPDTATTHEVVKALEEVGFEVLEHRDLVENTPADGLTWYHPLTPSYNILTQRFQFTPIGLAIMPKILQFMEKIRLAPQGTYKVQTMLQQGALGLAKAGEHKLFTPMFLCVARKPLN